MVYTQRILYELNPGDAISGAVDYRGQTIQSTKGKKNDMESSNKPNDVHKNYRKAWTAYIRPLVVFVIIVSIGVALISNGFPVAGPVLCAFAVGLLGIQILTIRSIVLYTNDHGVWVYRGIFPWSKGSSGVKWRDLEDAVYFTGFWSWALKSYTIRVGHRFTKSSEIVLSHIARGNLAVEHINRFHNQVLALESQA